MHILQLYKDYFPVLGGIENHVRLLAEGLAARGHRVTVLATNTGPDDAVAEAGGLRVIKAGRALHLASTPLSPRMLLHAAALRDVDLVHLHMPYPPGDLAARLVPGGPPLVITYHSDIVRQRRLLLAYGPLLRSTLRRAARIIATSPAYIAGSPFLAPLADRCAVVPLGIDLAPFLRVGPADAAAVRGRFVGPRPLSAAAPARERGAGGDDDAERPDDRAPLERHHSLILFVGRLRYYKGLHLLLAALPLLRRPARLLVAGVGPELARLQAQARDLGLGDRAVFLGEVPDAELPALFAAADVFVLPSHLRAEAFGIVQIEAQAAGKPVVCAELGTGTSYVTRHGQTGVVVPPDDPPALARAIDALLASPGLAHALGAAGRARAMAEFSHTTMIGRVEDIYRLVAGGV